MSGQAGAQSGASHRAPAAAAAVALFVLAVSLVLGTAARSAPTVEARAERALPPVSIVFKQTESGRTVAFEPNTLRGAANGDTVRICNRTNVFSGLFSYDKENRFGVSKGLRLMPNQCTTVKLHNTRPGKVKVRIGDELHAYAKLDIHFGPRDTDDDAGTTTPAKAGAFPGGTATTLKLTVGGKSQTRNLKTGAVTPAGSAPTIVLKSGTTTGGSVELNGTLPAGWKVFVWHPTPATTLLNNATGGDFSGITADAGFDAFTGVGAYICGKDRPPPGCNPPAGQANIYIDWNP
jgi:hypothetical protein